MEDPIVRVGLPGRLVRLCQRSRLERQLMNDAYECLVPVVRCRLDREGQPATPLPAVLEGRSGSRSRLRAGGAA